MPLHMFHNKEQLFHLLAHEASVLTPNNRLSELIIQHYFIHSKSQTLDKPECMPYRVALIKAYEQLNFLNPDFTHPTLLNEAQCQHLWRTLIKAKSSITYSEGLLNSVMSAWERCQQWQIHPDDPNFNYTAQTRQFQEWWQSFEEQLKQLHCITEYQLIPYLVQTDSTFSAKAIVWVSFDDFTPQQTQLQHHLSQKGIDQYHYDLQEKYSEINVLAAQNDKEECQQLMAWLELKLQEGNQRIGVVVPNLEHESPSLQRTLANHFEPALFNISLGQSLSDFPLVGHALCWLSLDATLNPHQTNLLLQSPYLGCSKEEFTARSEYLQESVLLRKHVIPLKSLIGELHQQAPQLAELLSNLTPYPKEATVHEWICLFQDRLNALGFPGAYGLNSENYQCLNRFLALFDELRQFSLFRSKLTKTKAIEALGLLAENTIFQAQKTNAPIQISGLLEASGCEFDSLWVMGLTDQILPQKVQLSAFIPPQMQRELHMPHSLPERELQFARQILQRLHRSAHCVVFSYPLLQGDTPNLPCSLITEFPAFTSLAAHNASIFHPALISMEEQFNVPVLPEEHIAGGTAILSNQAKCPFKAFAEHRLRALECSQATDGLDNKERGHIIHKVMELLWLRLESQQKLLNLTPEGLEHYIDESINIALAPLKKQDPASFSDSIQEVEFLRLKRLVHTYLEWEKQRPDFTVSALEQSYSINIAGLDFKVRVDRLDQVAENKWVIDYKSTLPTSKPWNENRPRESQLLVYSLLDKQINTLVLMQLKAGKIVCSGLSEEKTGIMGITSLKKEETWSEFRETWQHQLTDLATEFQQGYCPPQPSHVTICQQCNFQNLCRFQVE